MNKDDDHFKKVEEMLQNKKKQVGFDIGTPEKKSSSTAGNFYFTIQLVNKDALNDKPSTRF